MMKTVWKTKDIDWSEVLEELTEDKAIKVYFHNSQEVLMVVKINDTLLTQNSIDLVANIHSLQNMKEIVNGNPLEALVKGSLFQNDLKNISSIETVDFEITLIELD